jgi:SAM-dependent methyltransferase
VRPGIESVNGKKNARLFPSTGMPDPVWWSELWPNPEVVLRQLGVRGGEHAVDLCCGDGRFTSSLVRLANPARVYALDLDPEMIEETIARVSSREERCIFIRDDARCLTAYISEPVGFVLLANTFHGAPGRCEERSDGRAASR